MFRIHLSRGRAGGKRAGEARPRHALPWRLYLKGGRTRGFARTSEPSEGALSLLQVFIEEGHGCLPGAGGGFGVGFAAGLLAEEAMAGAFVDVGGVGLAELFHLVLCGLDGGVDPGVVGAVEAKDGGLDVLEVVGAGGGGAVVDDGGV